MKQAGFLLIGVLMVGFLAASSAAADSTGFVVASSLGEETLQGVKTHVLEVTFSEEIAREDDFVKSDLEKNREAYLKMRPPILVNPRTGHPYPYRFVGREVKQKATQDHLSSQLIFKYQHPGLEQEPLDTPILIAFEGKVYRTGKSSGPSASR